MTNQLPPSSRVGALARRIEGETGASRASPEFVEGETPFDTNAPFSVAFYLRRLLRMRREALAVYGGRRRGFFNSPLKGGVKSPPSPVGSIRRITKSGLFQQPRQGQVATCPYKGVFRIARVWRRNGGGESGGRVGGGTAAGDSGSHVCKPSLTGVVAKAFVKGATPPTPPCQGGMKNLNPRRWRGCLFYPPDKGG